MESNALARAGVGAPLRRIAPCVRSFTAARPPSGAAMSTEPRNDAVERPFADLYGQLKTLASRQLSRGARGVTLDTTSLVHELFLRMHGGEHLDFAQDGQFFTYAARAMRSFLIDRARAHLSQRSGGEWVRVTLTAEDDALALRSADQVIALDAALAHLADADARAAEVVELRYFCGLSADEVAEVMRTSRRTVTRDWAFALAFLRSEFD